STLTSEQSASPSFIATAPFHDWRRFESLQPGREHSRACAFVQQGFPGYTIAESARNAGAPSSRSPPSAQKFLPPSRTDPWKRALCRWTPVNTSGLVTGTLLAP